jgi:O-antigen/teichoic acid export membrane protein
MQGVSKSEMAAVLREYRRYPVFTFPGTALSALSAALMTFSFTQLFSVNVAGQYGLVLQFVMAPLGAIAFSVSQVFTGDLSKAIADAPPEAHRIYRRVVRILTLIGVPGAIIGYFAGPWIIRLVFGAQWDLAAEFCALSIPMALSTFIVSPINMVLILTRDNKMQIYWEIGRFVTIAAAYLAFRSVLPPDPRLVMGVFSGLTFVTYMVYLVIADRALRNLRSRLP